MTIFDMMKSYPPSLAAIKKLDVVPENFAFYEFGWLGDKPEEWTVMEVKGAVFRAAKSGKNKGELSIKVPDTDRTIYVTAQEIEIERPEEAPGHHCGF